MVAKHGGFRKGAGRPKGSRNRATIARDRQDRPWIQEEIADSGGIATVSAPGPVRSAERYCSCSAQLWLCLYENSAGHEKADRPLVAGTMTAPSASVGDHPLPYAPQAVSPPAATVTYMLSAVSGPAWLFYNALDSYLRRRARSSFDSGHNPDAAAPTLRAIAGGEIECRTDHKTVC